MVYRWGISALSAQSVVNSVDSFNTMKKRTPIIIPKLGEKTPRQRRPIRRRFVLFVMWLTGWRIKGELPNLAKFVTIGGPHTSNWDIIVTLGTLWVTDLRVSWLVKHTAARWPFGWFIRRLGGIPIDRNAPQGVVAQVTERFQQGEGWILLIAPEGTRRKVGRWKTGFHRIARSAGLPILTVAIDFGNKTVILHPLFEPTDDLEGDIAILQAMMAEGTGHNRELEI
ncbi:MAG TPA: acyltransferase [Anaerolineae bacterium]|nr:acyltransferase [Anaerolineae bacterium]